MLSIRNSTRNTIIVERGRVANNSWNRLVGLIGTRDLHKGDGLMIEPCKGVHTMFMSIPIDVLYVDQDDEIVAIDENMHPWRMGRIYRDSRYVLELPVGTVHETSTCVGDKVELLTDTK